MLSNLYSLSEILPVLIMFVLMGVFLGVGIERFLAHQKREEWKDKNSRDWGRKSESNDKNVVPFGSGTKAAYSNRFDATDQLRIVMSADFSTRSILNKSEARVFKELDRMVIALNPEWQVMAQVSLGEIMSSKNKDAYRCINSKRVDLLLMDEHCQPRHAIEYQGSGHHQGTAAARDAVKKEALRKAGIGYHEVIAGHTTPSDLLRLAEKLVDPPVAHEAVVVEALR